MIDFGELGDVKGSSDENGKEKDTDNSSNNKSHSSDIDMESAADDIGSDEDACSGAHASPPSQVSKADLRQQYATLKLPFDSLLSVEGLQKRLDQVASWESLPLEKLALDAQAMGVKAPNLEPDSDQTGKEGEEHARRKLLEGMVLESWAESWRAWDVPAGQIGLAATEVLLRKFQEWQEADRYELLEECRRMSVPSCAFAVTRPLLMHRLRKVLTWKVLPMATLVKECETHVMESERADVVESEFQASDATEKRLQLVSILLKNLLLSEWEAQGIPARELGGLDAAAQVAEELAAAERMTMADLWRWYNSLGLPRVRCLGRPDLLRMLKKMTILKALPLTALFARAGRGEDAAAATEEANKSGSEEPGVVSLLQQCLDDLFAEEVMAVWDAHGFGLKRLGRFDAARELVMHQERLEGLSNEVLKQEYKNAGFVSDGSQERVDLISTLRQVVYWEMLSLSELEAECARRSLPIKVGPAKAEDSTDATSEDDPRIHMLQQLRTDLTVEKCRGILERRGIPVPQLGTLMAAQVAAQLDVIEAAPLSDLQTACEDYGVPSVSNASRIELLRILRDLTVWMALPVHELEAEAMRRLQCSGEAIAKLGGENDDEKRENLLDALMLGKFTPEFDRQGVPAERLSSFSTASVVSRAWLQLESQNDDDLARKYIEVGGWYLERAFPEEKAAMTRDELLSVLKKTVLWQELPLQELSQEVESTASHIEVKLSAEGDADVLKRRRLVGALIAVDRIVAWDGRGFQTSRMSSFDVALEAVTQMEAFKAMGDEELEKVHTQSGLPTSPQLDREKRLRGMQDLLLWELLPDDELKKECREKGLPLDCDRDSAIHWLVLSSQGHQGIPFKQLRDLGAVEGIIREVERFRSVFSEKGVLMLRDEYKKRTLPFDQHLDGEAHIGRLRQILVWEHTSTSELQCECRKLGVSAALDMRHAADSVQRGELIKRLVLATWQDTWVARGIPAQRVGSLALIEELMVEIDKTQSESQSVLTAKLQQRGLCIDEEATLEEIREHMKQALLWEYMPMGELQKECREQKTPVALAPGLLGGSAGGMLGLTSAAPAWQPGGLAARAKAKLPTSDTLRPGNHLLARRSDGSDDGDPRRKMMCGLMERRLEQRKMSRWEDNGIPIARLSSFKDAEALVGRHKDIDKLTRTAALKWYQDTGFPKEAGVTTDEIKGLAKLVILWEALPAEELRQECTQKGLPLPAGSADENGYTQQLKDKLLIHERMTLWESKGFPARRIGEPGKVMQVVANNEHYSGLSLTELQAWYKELGLPIEQGMGRDDLEKLAKTISIWQAFPLHELEAEWCTQSGTPFEATDKRSEEERRQKILDALLWNEKIKAWEQQGFQPRRLGESALHVVKEYEHYEDMDDTELREACRQAGLPVKASGSPSTDSEFRSRRELLQAVKTVLLWEVMPVEELMKECAARTLPTVASGSGVSNSKQQSMVDYLKMDLAVRMDAASYESLGISLNEVTSIQAAQVKAHWDKLEATSYAELCEMYKDAGLLARLPGDSDAGVDADRHQLCDCLKMLVLWQEYSASSLRELCNEKGVPTQAARVISTVDERRDELIRRLSSDMVVRQQLEQYEALGIPVQRVTTIAIPEVARRYAEIQTKRADELRDMHRIGNIPGVPAVSEEELRGRLRDVVVWEAYSAGELSAECRTRCIPMQKLDGRLQPEVAKEALLDLLLLHRCAESFRSVDIPVYKLDSFAAAAAIAREWSLLNDMQDAGLRARYSCYGVSPLGLTAAELRERLRTVVLWMQLPWIELREESKTADFYVAEARGSKMDMVRRLAIHRWQSRPQGGGTRRPLPPRAAAVATLNRAMHFRVLQLPVSAGLEDVKRAYRRLALKYHPDKNQGPQQEIAAQQFRKVADAYEALTELLRS